jgi:hypothetical protein
MPEETPVVKQTIGAKIAAHWNALAPKAKIIAGAALAYAGAMNIPYAKVWLSANLGQHPKLTALGTAVLTIVAVYQQPFVQGILTGKPVLKTRQIDDKTVQVEATTDNATK